MKEPEESRKGSGAGWALVCTAAILALLGYTGATTGEWQGVLVTSVQVLVVGGVAYLGLR